MLAIVSEGLQLLLSVARLQHVYPQPCLVEFAHCFCVGNQSAFLKEQNQLSSIKEI